MSVSRCVTSAFDTSTAGHDLSNFSSMSDTEPVAERPSFVVSWVLSNNSVTPRPAVTSNIPITPIITRRFILVLVSSCWAYQAPECIEDSGVPAIII